MRLSVAVVACCVSLVGLSVADNARASIRKSTNIPAEGLVPALKQLAHERGFQLVFQSEIVGSTQTQGAVGECTPDEALKQLLKGTGLSYRYLDEKTITIIPLSLASEMGEGSAQLPTDGHPTASNASGGLWGSFLVAQAAPGQAAGAASVSPQDANQAAKSEAGLLQEVVVTAQKRSEPLLEVPVSVNAISGERLESLQINTLADLANFIPGLSVTDGGAPGSRLIEIRGLSTNYYPTSGALVATYVDDLPIGDSTNNSRGELFNLDLNPFDVERIEVLKGPQGTLYGANTMGGLVKYVLRSPDLNSLEVRVGADGGYTDRANAPNWSIRAAVSLPIVSDALAVRVSGFYRYNAGYIDNVTTGANNINHSTEEGGIATLLYRLSDDFQVRAYAIAQNVDAANQTAVTMNGTTLQPLFGPLTISSNFAEPFTQESRVYGLTFDWNLHFATLVNTAGWSRITSDQMSDFSQGLGVLCVPNVAFQGSPGCPGYPHPDALVPFVLALQSTKFVEELRLASPEDQRIQWMIGGYYTKELARGKQTLPVYTPSHVPVTPPLYEDVVENVGDPYSPPYEYKEAAGFANLTYRFSNRFDLGAGARYSAYEQLGPCPNLGANGILGAPPAACTSLPSTGVTLWSADARYHLAPESMVYARVATGYRPGGGCPTCGEPNLGIPGIVNPDKTKNYEIGYKAALLDRRLQLSAAAFHIDWTDIQLTQQTLGGVLYPGNGGTAVSNGFELTAAQQISTELVLNATLAYTNARLTQDAPGAGGKSGDQLPGSPLWTASLTADYRRPMSQGKALLMGAAYRYRDGVVNQFEGSGIPLTMGPQNLTDLYVGMEMRDWTVRLNGRNVFNNRSYNGLLFVDAPSQPNYVPVQPATISLSVDYRYSK
jgi:outer membrane receptor protein involved in Fe transport